MGAATTKAATHLVRAAGFLALAVGFRIGLRLWIGAGANDQFERVMILCSGSLMLICTGFAAGQAALGFMAFMRRRD